MRAAVLWAGKDAVAHGASAAWWHDLGPSLPATVEVTVRRSRNLGKQPGVSVRRRDLPCPGWAWHMTADRFVADRRRQNALVNARWTVLRFTWHDLDARPDDVLNEIRVALTIK